MFRQFWAANFMDIFHKFPRWINTNGEHQCWRWSSQLSIATSPSSKGYLSSKLCIDEHETLKLNYRSCIYRTVLHLHDFAQSLGIIVIFNNSQTYPNHQWSILSIPWIKKSHFCIIDQRWISKLSIGIDNEMTHLLSKDQILSSKIRL